MDIMYQESYNVSPHTRSPAVRSRISKAMRNNTNKCYTELSRDKTYSIYGLLNEQGRVVYCGMTSQPLHTRLLQHYAVSFGQSRPDALSFALRSGTVRGVRAIHTVNGYARAQLALVHAICLYNTKNNGFNTRLPAIARSVLQ